MATVNAATLLTMAASIFVAELTDKDAFLLLTLATRNRAWFVFAAGSTAFTITTAIITTSGYFLLRMAPVPWIKLVGGVVMISYGLWTFFKADEEKFSAMLDEYYQLWGWDPKTGKQTREGLEKIGLKDLAERLFPPTP